MSIIQIFGSTYHCPDQTNQTYRGNKLRNPLNFYLGHSVMLEHDSAIWSQHILTALLADRPKAISRSLHHRRHQAKTNASNEQRDSLGLSHSSLTTTS